MSDSWENQIHLLKNEKMGLNIREKLMRAKEEWFPK